MILDVEKKLKEPSKRPGYGFEEKQKLLLKIPENYLNKKIEDILFRYNLPDSYRETIRWYILYNKLRIYNTVRNIFY